MYGSDPEDEKRYTPAKCISVECKVVQADPDPKHILHQLRGAAKTSRCGCKCADSRVSQTRLAKRSRTTRRAIALYFIDYNFGRVHQTLRVTPAMEAGVANHVWSVEEIVGLLG